MPGDLVTLMPDLSFLKIEGLIGNYRNFFFRVNASSMGSVVDKLTGTNNAGDFGRIVDTYGVRRTSPDFWAMSDWFNDRLAENQQIDAGLLDLNCYSNF